ncbi:MAG: hypothetical protein GWN67_10120, partial [Phycisphaerae bacterium]|nr:hypothetical protein [Phycisphaerae bacterium]NIW78612.1 hypothetical protein [Calditrichia bacterium]
MSEKKSPEISNGKELEFSQQSFQKNNGPKGETIAVSKSSKTEETAGGMRFENYFSQKNVHPFDEIK